MPNLSTQHSPNFKLWHIALFSAHQGTLLEKVDKLVKEQKMKIRNYIFIFIKVIIIII